MTYMTKVYKCPYTIENYAHVWALQLKKDKDKVK